MVKERIWERKETKQSEKIMKKSIRNPFKIKEEN